MAAFDLKSLRPERTCLLMIDMQNDFLHEEGAYGRAGCTAPAIAALAPRLASIADIVRNWGGWTAVTLFTLVPGRGGEPMIAPHLKRLRPFLAKGDFAPGSWGQDAIAALKPVDFLVEKVAYSAFHQSRLDFTLRKAGIDTLIVGGIVTNGGVASTLRAAHVLEYETVLLSDGAAAFDPRVHAVTVEALGAISAVATSAELIAALAPS